MAQADQGAEDRRAGDKGLGAVDGIDRPDELGIGLVVGKLLADAAVLRAPVPRSCRAERRSTAGSSSLTGLASSLMAEAKSPRKCSISMVRADVGHGLGQGATNSGARGVHS